MKNFHRLTHFDQGPQHFQTRKQGPKANAPPRQGTAVCTLEEGEHLPSCGGPHITFSATSPTGHPALKCGPECSATAARQGLHQAHSDDSFSFIANHCPALLCPLTRSKAPAGPYFYYYSISPSCQKPLVMLPDWASQRLRM